jgi:hypothetical protein
MQKRGQFFLIAALITVGILFSLTSTINEARTTSQNEAFYDLSSEIKSEGAQVINYGVYNQRDSSQLLTSFLEQYAAYIAQDRVIFVFGNEQELQGFYFSTDLLGSVGIVTGGGETIIPIRQMTRENAVVRSENGEVSVAISGVTYRFDLREGENFFFVIIKERDDESFVSTG